MDAKIQFLRNDSLLLFDDSNMTGWGVKFATHD